MLYQLIKSIQKYAIEVHQVHKTKKSILFVIIMLKNLEIIKQEGTITGMAHQKGFEPLTDRFVADYSIQLSYWCVSFLTGQYFNKVLKYCKLFLNGGQRGIRTLDTSFILVCSLSRGVPSASRSSILENFQRGYYLFLLNLCQVLF